MRITKVYTRGGDRGMTSLVGGQRVRKDAPRIQVYGTVDELSSVLGLARAFNGRAGAPDPATERVEAMLRQIQNELFVLGSELATPAGKGWEGQRLIGDADVERLEGWIDSLNEDLGPLTEFILPGGGPVGGFLHQGRTICRRAERELVGCMEAEQLSTGPLRYLNRLSDLLFVLARWAARAQGEPELLWERD